MDFSKLSYSDLLDFLNRDYSNYGVQQDLNLSQIEQAQQFFTQLQNIPNVTFPTPIIDLYLSSIYTGPRNVVYAFDQILNLTPQQVQAFDQVFQFNASLNDLRSNRKRILKILKYLDLLVQPEKILLQISVLEKLCPKLSYQDLNTFRLALDQVKLPCSIPVQDPDGQIDKITSLNDQTDQLIQSINERGSIQSLIKASRNGHFKMVQSLLEQGVNPDLQNRFGWNALMKASEKGHLKLVQLLLNNGANPDIQDREKWTALIGASEKGHLEIVRVLLEQGVNPNHQPLNGKTALIRASRWGHLEVVKLLLKEKADPNFQARYEKTALMKASKFGHLEVVQVLLEQRADPNLQDRYGETALIMASREGYLEIVQWLLKKGANPNHQDQFGWSSLILASQRGYLDIVRSLLDRRANPNFQNDQGETALILASRRGHLNVVQLLQQYGAQ